MIAISPTIISNIPMLVKPTNYFLCIVLFSFLLSCSSDKSAKLIDTNFEQEINADQNLNFVFDKPMVADSLVGIWDSTEYIRFEPKIAGAFKWYSESVLIFSPNKPFPPATEYKATLTEKIAGKSKFSLGGEKVKSFQTKLLEVSNINTLWSSANNDETLIHLNIDFNYKIDPEEVLKKLKISIDGKEQKVSLIKSSSEREVKLFLPDVPVSDETFKIEVKLDKGIVPIGGNIGTDYNTNRLLSLISPYNVRVEDITPEHNGVEGILTVDISQETTADAKKFINISPNLSYEVETTETGLKIKSDDFDPAKRYTVVIKQGLKGKYGGKLKNDFSKDISFGELRPEITFDDDRSVYLSAKGAKNIKVKIINVNTVKVRVSKLYENNILSFQNGGNGYYDYDYYDYDTREVGDKGDIVWEKSYTTGNLPKKGGHRVLTLDIEDKIKNYNGIYAIQVLSDEQYWLKDFKLISISDIGLVAKEGKKDITVFTNSIKTATPQSGVDVKFIGINNQVIGSATTDGSGVAIFQKPENMPSGFSISMITAKYQDDYNYMNLSNTGVSTSRFDIGGKYNNLSGFDVFLYGDRDIYRPGETIYLSAIVRDENWNTPESIPVKVAINTPDGKRLKTIKKTLNEFGSFETSLPLSAAAQTGSYSVSVYTSNDIFLTSKNIKVEEFIPDRIKVAVDIGKTAIDIDESSEINLKATNFFGPPAANRNYEISISASRKYFYAKGFNEYNFSHELPNNVYFDRKFSEGKTDENGEASYSYSLEEEYRDMGLVNAEVYSTVFDETGRPVNRKNTITVSTQDSYFGIATDQYYAATNSEFEYKVVALDKSGKVKSNVRARLRLIKHEYKTVLSRYGSYYRYRSEKIEKVIEDKEITVSGTDGVYKFVPELSGRYEIRISAPGVRSFVKRNFYAYGWGGTSNSSFEVNSEGQIDIQLDKDSYEVGETANVILKAPFSGKILVTIETDKVLRNFYVESDGRAASFPIQIESDYVPNVYITATLFKPHEESDLPLTIAHGVAPIMVENPANKLPLSVEVAEKSRSKTKQKIKIKSAANTAVSVAVVDEGILQLTQYKTPDPYKHFYRKKALGVNSYDIYPFLFPEININSGRPGGDDSFESELAKRINPLTNKRVKLVAFWSGILQTDSDGEAEYEIDIPQFSGDLRIMATAYKGKAFSAADENMKVADPLVISTALPRFFSPGDTIVVPVVMTNTTEKSTNCKTNISITGPLTLIGSKSLNAEVGPNAEGRVTYKLVANQELGQTNVTVDVKALGESFKNSTDITIRPASPLQKVSGSGVIKAGQNKTLTLSSEKFIPQSIQRTLVISNSPMAEFTEDLDYLLRYPHGCVEQTVSAVFPQLYFQDLSRQVLSYSDEGKNKNNNYYITEAIKKLQLMQLYNGGLTYWPGGGYESWWGSVYAAHFLYEAQKAGFEVDQGFYDRLLDYLVTKLKTKETIWYYYNSTRRKIAHKEIPYSLYVLAMAGKPQQSTMNYYKSNMSDLSLDGKYMLAASYAIIGDDKKYREVLPGSFSGEISKRVFGGSFYSYIRDEALALNVLVEVDKDNPQIGTMAKHLTNAMKTSRYLNTQERTFGFLALGKIARQNANSDIKATVKSNGKSLGTFSNQTATFTADQLALGDIEIETSGSGNLYYFWNTEGINADGSYREEDSYLKVRKEFYDRNGNRLYSNTFEQNDLVVVKLSIASLNGENVENVAMTDILPAGFEIENPRISEVPGTDWIKNANRPTYSDIRDDRITFFLDTGTKERKYYYVVRAVSKGTFQMGPVGADAMYDGEYHSYSGGGTITVK